MGVLKEASAAVHDRGAVYAPPAENFRRIAERWSITLGVPIKAWQVAACMIDVKLARLANDPTHWDSLVDIAGYAECWGMIVQADRYDPE